MSDDRVEGTSADFNDDAPLIGHDDPVGGWVEVGRTKLTSANSNVTVSNLPNKRYYMVLFNDIGRSATDTDDGWRLNGDTGSNYARRRSVDGGADSTLVSQNNMVLATQSDDPDFGVAYFSNLASKEKIVITHKISQSTAGAGNAPQRNELIGKWTNTTDAIYEITWWTGGANTWNAGAEVVVLGYDPSDTHSTNFWKQLADVTASGSSTKLSSGIIPNKKYLWIQVYLDNTTSHTTDITFNGDTGTNYTDRYSTNGASDSIQTSQSKNQIYASTTTPTFTNMFIRNNPTNEKVIINHTVIQNTAGATNPPDRREQAFKWANTTDQITEIDIDSSSGNWASNSRIIVWGAD